MLHKPSDTSCLLLDLKAATLTTLVAAGRIGILAPFIMQCLLFVVECELPPKPYVNDLALSQ